MNIRNEDKREHTRGQTWLITVSLWPVMRARLAWRRWAVYNWWRGLWVVTLLMSPGAGAGLLVSSGAWCPMLTDARREEEGEWSESREGGLSGDWSHSQDRGLTRPPLASAASGGGRLYTPLTTITRAPCGVIVRAAHNTNSRENMVRHNMILTSWPFFSGWFYFQWWKILREYHPVTRGCEAGQGHWAASAVASVLPPPTWTTLDTGEHARPQSEYKYTDTITSTGHQAICWHSITDGLLFAIALSKLLWSSLSFTIVFPITCLVSFTQCMIYSVYSVDVIIPW